MNEPTSTEVLTAIQTYRNAMLTANYYYDKVYGDIPPSWSSEKTLFFFPVRRFILARAEYYDKLALKALEELTPEQRDIARNLYKTAVIDRGFKTITHTPWFREWLKR